MIPITVRLSSSKADVHITDKLSGLSWRSIVPGGYASASFSLQSPIDVNDPMLAPFTRVYIYDGRDGAVLWEGRLQMSGRTAGDQGQVWSLTAIGPSSHTSDEISPLVYIDRRLEPWRRSTTEGALMPAACQVTATNHPTTNSLDVILCQFGPGLPVVNSTRAAAAYDVLVGTGMFFGAIGFSWDAGFTSSTWSAQLGSGVGGTHLETPFSATGNTAGGSFTGWVVTDIPAGRDVAFIRLTNSSAGAVTITDDIRWIAFSNIRVLGRRVDVNGVSVSGSAGMVSSFFVHASWVIADLLGRGMLSQFDGPGAEFNALDTIDIDQLAYEDAVTPNQVLDDLMKLEPAAYWAAWESNAAGKYRFEWSNWPTTPQYEASVIDGFDNPAPTFEMYNKINVRYKDSRGITRVLTKTQVVPALDDEGLVREGYIDLGDEVGSASNANAAADTFLSEHAGPYSVGTLTVARPIMDINGRTVMPWQIVPGKLIRVRGIEASHQITGAATWDGITVFRIVSVECNSDGVATLELDMFTQTEARAMWVLAKKRNRKR
jgi:hypothetical protein